MGAVHFVVRSIFLAEALTGGTEAEEAT